MTTPHYFIPARHRITLALLITLGLGSAAPEAALILPEPTAENCVNPTVLDPLHKALREHQINDLSELDAVEAWIGRCRLIITEPQAESAQAGTAKAPASAEETAASSSDASAP